MSSAPTDPRDVLRRALVEIRSLKEKLAAAEKKVVSSEPIAVVGIGCRFAGGITVFYPRGHSLCVTEADAEETEAV